MDQVIARDAVVLDCIADHSAEERDIGAGAKLHELVGQRRGAREPRVHHNHLGIALALGFDRPLETARMVFRGIATHDQHHVGVLDVDPAICHRTATERGPQTGDRRSVSNASLVFEVADPQAAHGLDDQVIELVGIGAAAVPGNAFAAVDGVALGILLDERFVARLLDQVRDLVDGRVPRRCPPNDPSPDAAPAASAAAGR